MGWQEGVIQSIANFMYQNRHQLAGAFRSFDLNNDGEISSDEFRCTDKLLYSTALITFV